MLSACPKSRTQLVVLLIKMRSKQSGHQYRGATKARYNLLKEIVEEIIVEFGKPRPLKNHTSRGLRSQLWKFRYLYRYHPDYKAIVIHKSLCWSRRKQTAPRRPRWQYRYRWKRHCCPRRTRGGSWSARPPAVQLLLGSTRVTRTTVRCVNFLFNPVLARRGSRTTVLVEVGPLKIPSEPIPRTVRNWQFYPIYEHCPNGLQILAKRLIHLSG